MQRMQKAVALEGVFENKGCTPRRRQMKKEITLILLLANILFVTNALAETLNGTWIFDAKATEDFVLKTTKYRGADHVAEVFGLAGHYQCIFIYEFNGDIVKVRPIGNDQPEKAEALQLISRKGNQIKYVVKESIAKNNRSKPGIVTVTVLNDKNIVIAYSNSPEIDFLLWKRMTLNLKQMTNTDFETLVGSWMESLKKVGEEIFEAKPD